MISAPLRIWISGLWARKALSMNNLVKNPSYTEKWLSKNTDKQGVELFQVRNHRIGMYVVEKVLRRSRYRFYDAIKHWLTVQVEWKGDISSPSPDCNGKVQELRWTPKMFWQPALWKKDKERRTCGKRIVDFLFFLKLKETTFRFQENLLDFSVTSWYRDMTYMTGTIGNGKLCLVVWCNVRAERSSAQVLLNTLLALKN